MAQAAIARSDREYPPACMNEYQGRSRLAFEAEAGPYGPRISEKRKGPHAKRSERQTILRSTNNVLDPSAAL